MKLAAFFAVLLASVLALAYFDTAQAADTVERTHLVNKDGVDYVCKIAQPEAPMLIECAKVQLKAEFKTCDVVRPQDGYIRCPARGN